MIEAIAGFVKNLFSAYSIPLKLGIILSILLAIIFIFKFINGKNKGLYSILVIPTVLTFLMLIVMSPYKSIRYVMFILPLISILFVIILDDLIESKKFSSVVLSAFAIYLSIYGIFTNPVNYLYIGYQKYLDIAEEYKDDRFVLVSTTVFSHIQDIPEFKTYKESLIIDPDKLKDLENFDEFKDEDEFILGIKNWISKPEDEVINEVLEYTGFENYELIHTSQKSSRESIYRIYK